MPVDELRDLIARHSPVGVATTPIPGVRVSRIEESGPPDESTTSTVLAIVAQGGKRLGVGGAVHECWAGQYLVASVDLPVTGSFVDATPAHPALGFALDLRPEVIADLLLGPAAGELGRLPRSGTLAAGIAVSHAPEDLLDAAVRMLRLLDRPRDIPVLAPMIEREIHWLLMTGEQGPAVRQLGLADSSLNHVRHAVRWIREHYAEAIRVEDLARLTRMSTSAFHRNFHAVTALSPIQFQKQIRLQAARVQLLADPRDVTAVAYAVGYESPSQFSREYRRQFGAPPGQDATRLRASATAAG